MLTKEQLVGVEARKDLVTVVVPGWPDAVQLRYPSFAEWHRIISQMKALGDKEPPAEMVSQTIGVCLANEDGSRMLTDTEALGLLKKDFSAVMYLLGKCWETVLKADVEKAEKN